MSIQMPRRKTTTKKMKRPEHSVKIIEKGERRDNQGLLASCTRGSDNFESVFFVRSVIHALSLFVCHFGLYTYDSKRGTA